MQKGRYGKTTVGVLTVIQEEFDALKLALGADVRHSVGTSLGYSVSVFGAPVALAARCAGIALPTTLEVPVSSYITFPAQEAADREFEALIPTETRRGPNGEPYEEPHAWRLLDPREVPIKNLQPLSVGQLINEAAWLPSQSAEDRAREVVRLAAKNGRRWVPPCDSSRDSSGA